MIINRGKAGKSPSLTPANYKMLATAPTSLVIYIMSFQPSTFSRQRLPIDHPKVLNLKQHSFKVAQSLARSSRLSHTTLARDASYHSSIPYLESREICPVDPEEQFKDMSENCDMFENQVEEAAEDLLFRCPTGQCRGVLLERELEGLFYYTCSEPTCVIRIEGSELRWNLEEVCVRLHDIYVQHHLICSDIPTAFLCHGRISVRCVCGLQHDFS